MSAAIAQDEPAHLLVVDDDARIRSLLSRFLRKNGFLVTLAQDAAQARRLLGGLQFDLIVLDVMMPGEDGLSLTRDLRRALATPILLLTARGEVADRIEGLESGADDYLAKPFEPRELVLRINAILRRVPAPRPAGPKFLSLGALRFDVEKAQLWQGETPLRLTTVEAALLSRLAQAGGEPVSRSELGEAADTEGGNSERAVDVQITRLRRKIEQDSREPRYLQTVRGTGYRLVAD